MTRIEPVGAMGESVPVLDTCEWCKRPSDTCEQVTVLACRQTHDSPAEYDDVPVCAACLERYAYLADPENAAYERARAGGWAD